MFLTVAFGDQVSRTPPSSLCDSSQKRGKSADSREVLQTLTLLSFSRIAPSSG